MIIQATASSARFTASAATSSAVVALIVLPFNNSSAVVALIGIGPTPPMTILAAVTAPPAAVTATAALAVAKSIDFLSANLINACFVPAAGVGTLISLTISLSFSAVPSTIQKSLAAILRCVV